MSQKSSKKQKKRQSDMESEFFNTSESKSKSNGSHDASNGDEMELRGFTAEEINSSQKEAPNNLEESGADSLDSVPLAQLSQQILQAEASESVLQEETNKEKANDIECVENKEAEYEISLEGENNEIEPLILDVEEPDPELEFDENSDIDSLKNSPVLNRCMTRRSQNRNIPTPKTPKSIIDQNGEASEDVDKKSEASASVGLVSETPENELDDMVTGSASEVGSTHSSEKTETDSLSNLSTRAVAGGDYTVRDFDLSCTDAANTSEPAINPYKEKSFSETLRGLSSRRTIRSVGDYRKYALKSNLERNNGSSEINFTARSSVERLSGLKRKKDSASPESIKRAKPDSPGLLSYITSPLGHLKTRFNRSEVPSSTPRLTGFKTNEEEEIFEEVNVSDIVGEKDVKKEENKWCSIM